MDGRCRECWHWEQHQEPFDDTWGTCRFAFHPTEWPESELMNAPAWGLQTRDVFGCVEFTREGTAGEPSAWVGEG